MQMNLADTLDTFGDNAPNIPPLPPEELAEKFPQFEMIECLGRGGMGVVYKARQKALDRMVAIKILAGEWQDEPGFQERFESEAKLLAQLSHSNIVTVHDFGEADGLYYIVMEYVEGVNLRDLLREGKMAAEQALAIVPPICEALEYAHDKGVVHRDIKPENLLLDRDGRVKIADFGIASLVGATGEKSGTPPYMAPEQSAGTVDRRADIYALGAVLYEMLTGVRPGKDTVAPSRKVEVDVKIDEMVLRAMEKEPERRYQTAKEFQTVVQTIANPPETKSVRESREAFDRDGWTPFIFHIGGLLPAFWMLVIGLSMAAKNLGTAGNDRELSSGLVMLANLHPGVLVAAGIVASLTALLGLGVSRRIGGGAGMWIVASLSGLLIFGVMALFLIIVGDPELKGSALIMSASGWLVCGWIGMGFASLHRLDSSSERIAWWALGLLGSAVLIVLLAVMASSNRATAIIALSLSGVVGLASLACGLKSRNTRLGRTVVLSWASIALFCAVTASSIWIDESSRPAPVFVAANAPPEDLNDLVGPVMSMPVVMPGAAPLIQEILAGVTWRNFTETIARDGYERDICWTLMSPIVNPSPDEIRSVEVSVPFKDGTLFLDLLVDPEFRLAKVRAVRVESSDELRKIDPTVFMPMLALEYGVEKSHPLLGPSGEEYRRWRLETEKNLKFFAMAIEAYRQNHGNQPENLEELVRQGYIEDNRRLENPRTGAKEMPSYIGLPADMPNLPNRAEWILLASNWTIGNGKSIRIVVGLDRNLRTISEEQYRDRMDRQQALGAELTEPKSELVQTIVFAKDSEDNFGNARIVVSILADGQLRIGGEKVSEEELAEKIKTATNKSSDHPVAIRADTKMDFKEMIELLNLCRKAGASNIAIAGVRPEDSDAGARTLENSSDELPSSLFDELSTIIRDHFPDAEVEVTGGKFTAKRGTRMFTMHRGFKTGEVSSQVYQEEGPKPGGFLLEATLQAGLYRGASDGAQTLEGPYFKTFIAAPSTTEGQQHHIVRFSFGSKLDPKFRDAIIDLVRETAGSEKIEPAESPAGSR